MVPGAAGRRWCLDAEGLLHVLRVAASARCAVDLPKLYAIVDVDVAARAGWAPQDLGQAYLGGGARLLQLRAKSLASGPFLDLAQAMADDARRAGATLVINDRADIAALTGAALHVGQDDLQPFDARRVVGPGVLLGYSTHTESQIDAALAQPVSYLAIGPVFGTATKDTGYTAVGLALVATAARLAMTRRIPVVAIGGITLDTALRVVAAGAASLAVITDLLTADPEARVRQYLAALA